MEKRQDNARALFQKKKIDALYITNFFNILYLTGFQTLTAIEREASVLITHKNLFIITDGRYEENVKYQISKLKTTIQNKKSLNSIIVDSKKNLLFHLKEIIKKENIKRLGFEKEDLKWVEYENLKEKLNTLLIPIDKAVFNLRAVKEDKEIEKIKKACEIADRCLKETVTYLKPGITEKEMVWIMEQWLREKGYAFAFAPIIAFDENTAIPHYHTELGSKRLRDNSIVLIDLGVKYQNYCSDITRMIVTGKPNNEFMYAYETLFKIQEEAICQLNQTFSLKNIDSLCREGLMKNGFSHYPHSTGHGIGLEVHEYPKISQSSLDILREGNVVTVEPGIYFPGKWGVRIEDTVAVMQKRKIQKLTTYPKKPVLL